MPSCSSVVSIFTILMGHATLAGIYCGVEKKNGEKDWDDDNGQDSGIYGSKMHGTRALFKAGLGDLVRHLN